MAEIRFNYGDKFTQTSDSNTGIGSTIPAAKLDIAGGTSAGSLRVSGIATLSSYQGFVNTKLSTTEDLIVEAGQSGSVSGEVVIGTGQTISVSTGATTGQGGIQSLKVYETFMPPVGGTADRPTDVKPGMVYYNKDFKTIEFWDGNFWKQVDNTTRRGRGVIGGGRSPNHTTSMEFIQFHTLGNGVSFGDLQNNSTYKFPNSSAVRGIFSGGYEPSGGGYDTNIINYITIASEGDAIDFGDLVTDSGIGSGASSSTRGIQFGGYANPGANHNVIQYIEMSTLGNSLDFGDTNTTLRGWGAANSTTRAVIAGGDTGSVKTSLMEFVTIAALGNGVEFGDLTQARRLDNQNASGSTRGVFMGGGWGSKTDTIDFVNHASLGNAVDFGNLINETGLPASSASILRGIVCGGYDPAHVNIIEFVTIATAGNAQDFGDMSETRHAHTAISDCHGGLGGF